MAATCEPRALPSLPLAVVVRHGNGQHRQLPGEAVTRLFRNELRDDFGTWPIAYIPCDGAAYGQVLAGVDAVADGDDSDFHQAWNAAGDRIAATADTAPARDPWASAKPYDLLASAFYDTSFHPPYGAPVDPRILAVYRKQVTALEKGLALGPYPCAPLSIPLARRRCRPT